MREELHQPNSDEDSDASHASADAARLHAVARRIQLREHASRQQQLQLHKQLQQQQQLLQQQQQQLHQQDALLRHQEQLLRQQEQQLASRETEAALLLRQVGLLQQQLEERADRLAAAEGNYMDAAALLHQLQQRVTLGSAARLLVEEVRQQQQEDTQHLYAEVRRLKRQLSLRMRNPPFAAGEGEAEKQLEREREAAADAGVLQCRSSFESSAAPTTPAEQQQQQQQRTGEQPLSASSLGRQAGESVAASLWCCAESAEAAACTAWGSSASCCCCSEAQHEAAVQALRIALHDCRCAMESRDHQEASSAAAAGTAAGAAVMAVTEALHRCPAAGADAEIVDLLLERLRAESMQIRVYAQQRRVAATASNSSSSAELQQVQQGGLAVVEEAMEREAYEVMGAALPQEVLLPLLAVQSLSTLLRLRQQGVVLANSRWLHLLREAAGSKFLEGTSCCSGSSSCGEGSGGAAAPGGVSPQLKAAGDSSSGQACAANSGEAAGERRQHVLLQLLMRGSGGVASAAGLLRQSAAPLALHASTLTDRESGNNASPIAHSTRHQPKATPQLLQLQELQQAAAAGEPQQQAELQQQTAAVSGNLRAWRSVVFEYAAKASAALQQHENAAALNLYTEALKLQQRLLDKQQQLDEATGGNGASSLSLLENTAKLAFNKASTSKTGCILSGCSARSALRLGRWICCLQSCSLCLSMTPNYKAAYETAAEACEWLLDFEGALNYMQLLRQHCPEAFSADHYHKRRLYEAQLQASSFQVLGIDRGAPKAAVNRAFRRMSIVWHPDKASALLNEARIALLDPESYGRQLLVPIQTLYRHPELLVAPTPPQQAKPSPSFAAQPEQLASEQQHQKQQQQLQQHSREQQQDDQQQETHERGPHTLEKLQQHRQQLLRSIGSLQRQQHELQRELEEHRQAAPQRTGSSSASNALRWQELQKLQQQQQNKQKKLAECESEIGQWLRRQPEQQEQKDKQAGPSIEGASSEWGRSEVVTPNTSSQPAPEPASRHTQQQQQEQEQQQERQQRQQQMAQPREQSDAQGPAQGRPYGGEASRGEESLSGEGADSCSVPEPPSKGSTSSSTGAASAAATAAAAAATAAAEVFKEAAAMSGRGKAGLGMPLTPSPWHSINSSDNSDTEVPTVRSTAYQDDRGISSSSSTGVPTAATPPPAASPSDRNLSSPLPACESASAAGKTPARAAEEAAAQSFRVFRSTARCGSRASSAGPQIRTGEAAAAAPATAAMATARRSLTTCICSAAPRRTTINVIADDQHPPPRANSTFWDETDSSSNGSCSSSSTSSTSNTSSSSSANESSASGSSDDDGRTLKRPSESQWAAAFEYGRGSKLSASAARPSHRAGAASLSSSSARSTITRPQQPSQHRQHLPVPPPRRVSATPGARRNCSTGSSSAGSRGKGKGFAGRRPFVRARDNLQRQHLNTQQQQQQQRQQLWQGAAGRRELMARTTPRDEAVQAEPKRTESPQQGAATTAWMRPPDFPEPFAAATKLPQPMHGNIKEAAVKQFQQQKTQQQQQQQQHFDYLSPESLSAASGQKDAESGRQRSPSFFAPSVRLIESFDIHGARQRDLQQAQLLHQQLQEDSESREACESSRHQLLFPDEQVLSRSGRSSAAAASAAAPASSTSDARPAAPGPAAASAPRPCSAAPAESGPAFFETGWAKFEGGGAASAAEEGSAVHEDRSFRWPVRPECVSGGAEANGSSKSKLPDASLNGLPSAARSAPPLKAAGSGDAACTTRVKARATSSGGGGQSRSSSGESSGSKRISRDISSSHSSRSNSTAELPADDSRQWKDATAYSRQQHASLHQQQQQPERFYHSVAQETPHQLRSPPEADSIFLMQWGMGAPPQRSSVPLLGHTGSSRANVSALQKEATATATPTRLFPQYGPSHLKMQQGSQLLRFADSFPGAGEEAESDPAAASTLGSLGRTARATAEFSRLGEVNDSEAAASSARQWRPEGQPGCAFAPSLGAWQPVLTRSSLPHSREGTLVHSPRAPQL
ncbi:hypothetical protein Efla_001039 [Eimeria flavescens]